MNRQSVYIAPVLRIPVVARFLTSISSGPGQVFESNDCNIAVLMNCPFDLQACFLPLLVHRRLQSTLLACNAVKVTYSVRCHHA